MGCFHSGRTDVARSLGYILIQDLSKLNLMNLIIFSRILLKIYSLELVVDLVTKLFCI